MTDVTHTH